MTTNYHAVIEKAGIKPSHQRVAVYQFLCEHKTHPTAETMFAALSPRYPTLSKATVYNTLKLFVERRLVQTLQLDNESLRFDANMSPHIHFKCERCGSVFDVFAARAMRKYSKRVSSLVPAGFAIGSMQTNIWGRCSECKDTARFNLEN